MSIGIFVLGGVLALLIIGMTALVILWAREESAKAVQAPLFERAQPGTYCVQLVDTGRRTTSIISLIRRASDVSLSDAYAMANHPPAIIARDISKDDAEWLVEQLSEKGATARVLEDT